MRQLKSLGGSYNELEEIQLVLSKRRMPEKQALINRYGGDWAQEILARNAAATEDDSQLKEQVKEDQEHNARYLAETQRQLAEQEMKGVNV